MRKMEPRWMFAGVFRGVTKYISGETTKLSYNRSEECPHWPFINNFKIL
jgi:hypothetical protein